MTREQVTRWSAIEYQTLLRDGQVHAMESLFALIGAPRLEADDRDTILARLYEIDRARDWQEHNAVAARYAMKELFQMIDDRAAELAPVAFLEAAE